MLDEETFNQDILENETNDKKKYQKNIIIDILNAPTRILVDENRMNDAQKHINLLHREYDGTLTLCIAQNSNEEYKDWNQYSFKPQELEQIIYKFLPYENVYITANGFWNYSRKIKDLRHLKAFVIDIDYYKVDEFKDKTQEKMWNYIKNKERYFFSKIGKPSLIINSGGGLYLIWLIESAHPNALPLWQLCIDELYKKFEKYGADSKSKDAAHVFRLCGSENNKDNKKKLVKFIELEDNIKVYDLEHFRLKLLPNNFEKYIPKKERDEFKEEIKKKKLERTTKKIAKSEIKARQVANLFTLYKLHYTRVSDLEDLVKLRNFEVHKYHCREWLLFYYRYFTCCFSRDTDKALKDALDLNNTFTVPLCEREVIEATKSAESYFYDWEKTFDKLCEVEKNEGRKFSQKEVNKFFTDNKCKIYTNKKIIDDLGITNEEMTDLKTIITKKEKNYRYKPVRNEKNKNAMKKKRRNEFGRTTRDQQKHEKMIKIYEMINKGYTQKDISIACGCSTGLVSRYKKELENGTYIIEEQINILEEMA